MIKKVLLFIFFVLITCLIAGLFGVIHNQITYSVAPEYFTYFKFHQFRISYYLAENEPRTAASLVGFIATWWTGLIIGGVIGVLDFWKVQYNKLLKLKFKSLLLVFVTTVICSIIGYFIGVIKTSGMEDWQMNIGGKNSHFMEMYEVEEVTDWCSFIKVGTIHNLSYLGGLAGLIVGVIYHTSRKPKSFHKSQ